MADCKIPLRNQEKEIMGYAIVSMEDYENVNKFKWNLTPRGYVRGRVNGKNINQHLFIMGNPPEKMVIDHINGIKFDNRRENLQFVTKSQNSQNKAKRAGSTSKYIGVSWFAKMKKWYSQSKYNSSNINLGYFNVEEHAAIAYDKFTLFHYGQQARTNGLVDYKDVINLTIDDFIKKKEDRDLPNNISLTTNKDAKNPYRVCVAYKKKKFATCMPTLETALEKLEEFKALIEIIKEIELKEHNNREIIRNEDGNPMIEVKNVKGEVIDSFIVSEDRWHEVMRYKWSQSNGYFAARFGNQSIKIHQFLMNIKVNESDVIRIDHIDKNPKNNTTDNLRISDNGKNSHNKTKRKGASSKYYGVSWFSRRNMWSAQIARDGNVYRLGEFKDELDAAKAYNKKAIELYGEYANLNVFDN